jgi:pimeloyl-ACP methyl ester carboxylesterase
MHSIEIGKFLDRIPYARVGNEENPILVINGGQGFMMTPDQARLSKDARRLKRLLPESRSFILLGYDPNAAKVTINDLADDVSKIIDQHLGGRADVMGISYGGVVAWRAATRSPNNVAKLVLLSSAPWFSAEGKSRLRRQIDFINVGDLVAVLREFTTLFRNPWLNLLLWLRIRFGGKRMVQRLGSPVVIKRYLEAMLESEEPGRSVISSGIPTTIIGGGRDQFFGESIVEAGVYAPHIRTSIFEGGTHMVPVECARVVKKLLSDLLGSR